MVYSTGLARPLVRISDLRFSYPDGTPALQGINLQVASGESVAVIGPNGAGKSSLLLCLVGILRGTGEVFINGERLTQRSAKRLRRKMALVFQDPDDQLFMPTLSEDVAFGPANLGLEAAEVQQRVAAALGLMNLSDKAQHPPHRLSFGEKRKAALATALALQPELLLLDEPASNLDPATRYELIEYLANFPAAKIIATHDLELARNLCSKCILLSSGRQIACGPIDAILADASLLENHRLATPGWDKTKSGYVGLSEFAESTGDD